MGSAIVHKDLLKLMATAGSNVCPMVTLISRGSVSAFLGIRLLMLESVCQSVKTDATVLMRSNFLTVNADANRAIIELTRTPANHSALCLTKCGTAEPAIACQAIPEISRTNAFNQ